MTPRAGESDLEAALRAFAANLEGYEIEATSRPFGVSLYLRWESRGVKRAIELQVARQPPAGVAVWATASKARKDRSLKMASLPLDPNPAALRAALDQAYRWAEAWKVEDFF